ncbi:MAG: serine/threonine protein phosphatase, partial [Clostridia bacterium]|nr:serine/threonine protein phosphatase [Clostridia bacterium]
KIYTREVLRLEMSLQAAKKLQINNEKIIFVTHYPPFNTKREPSLFTEMLERYEVYKVIFGHLHGYIHPKMYVNEINGIKYYLTSCDAVKNKLVLID